MKIWNFLLVMILTQALAAVEGKRLIQAAAIAEAPQIDGRLTEPCYSHAPAANDFVQFHPLNGAKAVFSTEVYVFFNQHNLYIAFRCHDPEPGKIKADVTPFAEFENNDEVTVLLDPYVDSRNYVNFTVNARGIRAGADTIWKAAASIGESGWSAEIEIPFKSLRFPARDIQEWGINFSRRVFRLNETDYWTPVNREQEVILASTFGILTGLQGIDGGNNLEIFPYAGVRNSRSEDVRENVLAYGLDLKYGITSNLTLDLTAAPDYSDVESDPFFYQTDPYEYALSESRPFYAESANFFSTAFSLFYSRRITNPVLALKVTGKEKGFALGALFAKNESAAGDRFHGVLRIKKDIFNLSNIGIIYSAVEGAGKWNRNIGFDFQLRIRRIYSLSGFAAFSFNEQAPRDQNGVFRLVFGKTKKRGWLWAGVFDRIEPNVSAAAGYIPQTDYQKIWLLPKYIFLWEGRFLERLQLTMSLVRYNSIRSGQLTSNGAEAIVTANFRNQIAFNASYLLGRDRAQILNEQGSLEWNREMFPCKGPYFSLTYSGNRLFQIGMTASFYNAGVYTENFRQVKQGKTSNLSAWMTVKFSPGWQWEWDFAYSGRVSSDHSVDLQGIIFSSTLFGKSFRL
jgi:hypothetical protein